MEFQCGSCVYYRDGECYLEPPKLLFVQFYSGGNHGYNNVPEWKRPSVRKDHFCSHFEFK